MIMSIPDGACRALHLSSVALADEVEQLLAAIFFFDSRA